MLKRAHILGMAALAAALALPHTALAQADTILLNGKIITVGKVANSYFTGGVQTTVSRST